MARIAGDPPDVPLSAFRQQKMVSGPCPDDRESVVYEHRFELVVVRDSELAIGQDLVKLPVASEPIGRVPLFPALSGMPLPHRWSTGAKGLPVTVHV